MRIFQLACLLLVGIMSCEGMKSYRGHHVMSTTATTEAQLSLFQSLEESYDVMFLREPSRVVSTEFVVAPEQKGRLLTTLRRAGLTVTVQSTDLQADIDAERRYTESNKQRHQALALKNRNVDIGHTFYRTVEEVNEDMNYFEQAYPHLAVRRNMAHLTHDGRTVYYLEVGTATDDEGNADKPVIFIEGLAHAREWIVTASLIYTIDTMLRGYSESPQMKDALTKFTWIFIPIVNPDGYHYTWAYDRFWRKNMRPMYNCWGVDLNRNYDVEFGKVGVSKDCMSDIYPGERAFSEPETQNVRDLFNQLKPRIVSFLSIHAYSQLLLYPWGYIASTKPSSKPDNLDELIKVGRKMRNALESQGRTYILGTAYEALGYAASGAAEDWALKEKPGIYSYCYELRPQSHFEGGFDISANHIIPSGKELLLSFLELAGNIP